MPKRTKNYHSWLLDRLTDPLAAANYLNAAMSDSEEMFLTALRNVAEARTMAKVAQEAGVNRESLYKALSAEGNPRLSTLGSVLNALGMNLFVTPQKSPGGAPMPPRTATTASAIIVTRNTGTGAIEVLKQPGVPSSYLPTENTQLPIGLTLSAGLPVAA